MTSTKESQQSQNRPLSRNALFYMILLAFQFGLQPALTRRFTPPTVCRSSVVFIQECLKFFLALVMLLLSGATKSALQGWSINSWIKIAGIPAALYSVQNLAALMAYQNLDSLTFNVLNQTKTLSAALCCYLVMGRRQSNMQIIALLLLLVAALVMERIVTVDSLFPQSSSLSDQQLFAMSFESKRFTHGVLPILLASFISGLAGALSQKNLQGAAGKNPYLFSMELCVISVIILAVSLLFSSDGELIREQGFWSGWTPWTLIPILTNSVGGIVVGLVTKYAGSVRKGFALIFGIFISGLIQAPSTGVSAEQLVGGLLAGISLWMHATYPATTSLQARLKQE